MFTTLPRCTVLLALAAVLWLCAAASADNVDDVDWYTVDRQVQSDLQTRDLLAWSDELHKALANADLKAATQSISVFLRAGQTGRAAAAVERLAGLKPPEHLISEIEDVLIERELWTPAGKLLDGFPRVRPGRIGRYTAYLMGSPEPPTPERLEATEQWLAARYRLNHEDWGNDYFYLLAGRGRLVAFMDNLKKAVTNNPADIDSAGQYLRALDLLAKADRPAVVWLGDVARPKLAVDAYDLGRELAQHNEHAAAVKLFDYSQSLPFTPEDAKRQRMSMLMDAVSHEKLLRFWTKSVLAKSCKVSGDLKRAQALAEELAKFDGQNIPSPDTMQLAGGIQDATGQRVIQGRVTEAEPENKNSVRYWLSRASYFLGRKENEQAAEAYLAALALPPDKSRYEAVRAYGDFLLRIAERPNDADQLYRTELKRVGLATSAATYMMGCIKSLDSPDPELEKRGLVVKLRWDDSLMWQYLAEQPRWDYEEEHLLRFLLDRAPKADQETALGQAEELAGPAHDPSRSKIVGWVFSRCWNRPQRALSLIQDAVNRLPKEQNRQEDEGAVFNLFEIHLALGDWRAAEKDFPVASRRLSPRETPEWLGQIAIAAAKAGIAEDAMRLWTAKVNLDLTNSWGLDEMAKPEGMKDRLRKFYGDLAARNPDNAALADILKKLQ